MRRNLHHGKYVDSDDEEDEQVGLMGNGERKQPPSDAFVEYHGGLAGQLLQYLIILPLGLPMFRSRPQTSGPLVRLVEAVVRLASPVVAFGLLVLRAVTVISIERAAGGEFRFWRVLPEIDKGMAIISPSTYANAALLLFLVNFWMCNVQPADLLPRAPWARVRLAILIIFLSAVEVSVNAYFLMHFKPNPEVLKNLNLPEWISGPEGSPIAQFLFFMAEWIACLLSLTAACAVGAGIRSWRVKGLLNLIPGTFSVLVTLVPCSAAILPGEPAAFITTFGVITVLLRCGMVLLLATESRTGRICCQSRSSQNCFRYEPNELPAVIITVLCGPFFLFIITMLLLSTTMTFWYLFLAAFIVLVDFVIFVLRRTGIMGPIRLPSDS